MEFQLTNQQRKCFGISLIEPEWECIKLIKSPYDCYDSYAYLEGNTIRKLIQTGEQHYEERTLSETVSDDKIYLLPKTVKGKPVKLSSSTLDKRTPVGMVIAYANKYFSIYNATSGQGYYRSTTEELAPGNITEFQSWVGAWCAQTGEKELQDIQAFAAKGRVHQKYAEGDFFRFRIKRNLWGYGRILLNYDAMRKKKVAFWDILAGKPLVVAVYHLVTEEPISDIHLLAGVKMIPSQVIMDNIFFYSEAEIIGNRPIQPFEEDYPIHYGKSIRIGENTLNLQCGRLFKKLNHASELFRQSFHNNGIGFYFRVTLPVLLACIREQSNQPYWDWEKWDIDKDLRNPNLQQERKQIFAQFGLDADDYVRTQP